MAAHGVHLTDAQRQDFYKALAKGEGTATALAEKFGINKTTAYKLRRELLEAGLSAMQKKKPLGPDERHDATFHRKAARKARKEVERLSALVRELAVIDGLEIGDADFASLEYGSDTGRATLIVHNSDRHMGEAIDRDEINGWNEYSPEVCRRRVQRFMDAACHIGRRWADGGPLDGVLYTMGGDEISGDIHEELTATNELTSLESVEAAVALHKACLEQLVEEFGRVHVTAVPGNHGRLTRKPQAKKYGALSYDIFIAKLTQRELSGDDRITWDIAAGPDTTTLLYGRRILTTHGDKIGTGGGKGFAGPVLPIIRGATQVRLQYGAADMRPELILMGHYHTSAAPPGVLSNGSVPGLSEYGFGLRGGFETPRQWLAMFRSKYGLSERLDVQLETPPQPGKPRVRVE